MLCEQCGKRKATVSYHENIDGRRRFLHLCADCATAVEKAGELEDMSAAFPSSLSPFLPVDEALTLPLPYPSDPSDTSGVCTFCGTNGSDILRTGVPGCATCMQQLRGCLRPMIRAVHGDAHHVGRIPRAFRLKLEQEARLTDLKKALDEAVKDERFEDAAALRDEIRAMEAP